MPLFGAIFIMDSKNFTKLTTNHGDPIYVNLNLVEVMTIVNGNETRIDFEGGNKSYIIVRESPEQILGTKLKDKLDTLLEEK